jgi:hypothetical protein
MILARVFLLAVLGFVSQPESQLEPTWKGTIAESAEDGNAGPVRQAWAPSNRCFAISTRVAVHVFSREGKELWQWRFRDANRLIRVGSVAVSPECDVVATAGDTDYKYVWIAPRRGRKAYFKTAATPSDVVFSTDGATVAVRTGAFTTNAYLASVDGTIRSATRDRDLPIRWPFDVTFKGDPAGPEFTNDDAIRLLEPRLFAGLGQTRFSLDGHWSVRWSVPSHGPGAGDIELRGPQRESVSWRKAIACPDALVTSEGPRAVVLGEFKSDDFDGNAYDCDDAALQIVDRDGNTLRRWPSDSDGHLVSWSQGERAFWFHSRNELRQYDFDGRVLQQLPALKDADTSMSPDRATLLIREGDGIRVFQLKGQ